MGDRETPREPREGADLVEALEGYLTWRLKHGPSPKYLAEELPIVIADSGFHVVRDGEGVVGGERVALEAAAAGDHRLVMSESGAWPTTWVHGAQATRPGYRPLFVASPIGEPPAPAPEPTETPAAPAEKVTDLLAALEESVAAAKAARQAHRASKEGEPG